MAKMSREELLAKVRQKMEKRGGGKFQKDLTQFVPPKVAKGEKWSAKFIVLPSIEEGDKLAGGATADYSMDTLPWNIHGVHWVEDENGRKRPLACPRVHDGSDCPICNIGFEMYAEVDKSQTDQRKMIGRTYMPSEGWAVNIYFPPYKSTPEEFRGKVMWFNITQRSLQQKFQECLERDESEAMGDTPDEAQAHGFFFLREESYVFNLEIRHKDGFNDFSQSKFLVSTKGPIVTKKGSDEPDDDKIDEILAQRHDLISKFEKIDMEKLEKTAERMLSIEDGDDTSSSDSSDDDEMMDEEEVKTESKSSTPVASNDDEELMDEEEEAPATSTKKKSTNVIVEDSSDEEELDDLLTSLQSDDD